MNDRLNIDESKIRDFFFEAISSYGLIHAKKELTIDGLRIDIFAIDKNHIPYIIEFKKNKNRHIVGQAAQYLALIPAYKKEVEKSINFYEIKWDLLKVLCIAPSFHERDFLSSKYEPFKNRIHFYQYKVITNTRNRVFSLNIDYKGPDSISPLVLPEVIVDEFDIIAVTKEFYNIKKKEARREYYSIKILPLLEQISKNLKEFHNVKLYPYITYWGSSYTISLVNDKKKSHRASITINFSESITIGFDLTHSLYEGKVLTNVFKDKKKAKKFIDNTLSLKDYYLWMPNSGYSSILFIDSFNEKGLNFLLSTYEPKIMKDCYFRILRDYDKSALNIKDTINIFKEEYNKFQYIFDFIRNGL